MPRLEEITYEAGRSALADQEALVSGIRQRTGTALAAHALVASFLGATTIHDRGLHALSWLALVVLVLGLVDAAVLLAPWKMRFAVDARALYDQLYEQAVDEAPRDTLGWLAAAACDRSNNPLARRPRPLESRFMAPKPVPPSEIKPPSTSIGIQEGRGGSAPPSNGGSRGTS